MPKLIIPEGLRELRRGDVLTASHVNALTRAARQNSGLVNGTDDGTGLALRPKDKAASFDLWAYTAEELPLNSVFTLTEGETWSDPVKVSADKVIDSDFLALFTNGDILVPADCWCVARPVGFERITRLRYSGTAPTVGTECGPDLSTYAISQDGQGLVCLSEPDPTDTWVWCMRVASAIAVEGWGVLTADLVQGSTATVDMISDDGLTYTGETITVTDTALNTDETIESGSKIYVKKKGSIYIWTNARCVISDTLPV